MKWNSVEIGEEFQLVRNGKSIKQKGDEGIPITRIETIATGNVNLQKTGYANIQSVKGFEDYLLQTGDILMSHINSEKHLGKVAIFEDEKEVIHGMNLLCLRPRSSLNSKFALLFFRSPLFRNQIFRITKKSVNQASFTVAALKKQKIPLPPLEIQKRIVALLDKAQELIDKRKEQITLMDQLIQSLFYDMFGDPVTNPMGWDKKVVMAISQVIQIGPFGSLLHQKDYVEGGVPLINPMHIQNSKVVPNYSFSITNERLIELSKYVVRTNDLIMGRRGEMGRCAIITNNEDGFLCGTGSLFIRPQIKMISPKYLLFVLSCEPMKKKLEGFSLGATMPNLNRKIIDNLEIPVPPIEMQNTFVEHIQKIETQKEAMATSLKELKNNFNSLMQRAFKGEL